MRYSAIRKPGGGFRKVYELGLYGSEVGVLYIYLMEQERWDAEGGRVALGAWFWLSNIANLVRLMFSLTMTLA